MENKKITFLTGTRADFGKLKSLITEVDNNPDFDYEIFATGMHLLEKYGATINEIKKSGFKKIFPFINQDTVSETDIILANTIQGLSHYVKEFKPNLIVVHGDRIESLAGAIVGSLNNILVAHIEGGEVSGTIDELIRHAISKLAHAHFVANKEAKKRLLQLGEIEKNVFVMGSPDIDIMLSDKLPTLDEVFLKYNIKFNSHAIFMYHPVTTENKELAQNIKNVVDALIASGKNYIVIFPNNDLGTNIIMNELQRLEEKPHFKLLPSMRFEYFLSLLKHAEFIIGNSSAGIREAPVYGVPTINIGSRQHNRFNYESIKNCKEEKNDILNTIKNIKASYKPSFHFGKGDSTKLFIKTLSTPDFWKISKQKIFKDLEIIQSQKN